MKMQHVDGALIDTACSRAREHLPASDAAQAEEFIRQYYRWAAPDDVAERSPLDIYGLALAHFNFARQRTRGSTKVHVYNPEFNAHGWQSRHTAVEIVTDDMPFLIDSVNMELNRRGFGVHLIIHPVLVVRRTPEGELVEVLPPHPEPREDAVAESVIHAEVKRRTDPAELEALRVHILRVIAEVNAAVEDWPEMRQRALDTVAELEQNPPPLDAEEVAEARAFLAWLEDDHFTFLGYREYDVLSESDGVRLSTVANSGLGILRQPGGTQTSRGFGRLPAGVGARALEPYLLNLTKANSRSTVHRSAYLDYVGVKRFDALGRVAGERRFLGLYTHTAYQARPDEIPLLRRKVGAVMERAAFPRGSHNEKALIKILEGHPRDELFQTSDDELFEIAMGILYLGERQQIRLFVRRDAFGRSFSCVVFVPRDRFNTENRRQIERILKHAFRASNIDYTTRVSESALVRLHYLVYTEPEALPEYDSREIEIRLMAATRSWADNLESALIDECGEERGSALWRQWGEAFPAAYRADWVPRSALADIESIEALDLEDDLAISLYRPLEAPPHVLRAKVFRSGAPLALSDLLPLFENMGVRVGDERPYRVAPREGEPYWIYDFGLTYAGISELEADQVRESFQDAFLSAWSGEVENDGYNRLVLRARLTWREISILRAVGRYLRQAGTTHSDRYLEQALVSHPDVARLLVELFCARFEPPPRRLRDRDGSLRANRGGDRRRGESRPGPDPPHLPGSRPGNAPHELLPTRPERPAEGAHLVQARPLGPALASVAPAAVRDLRVLGSHRGGAPARRQGGSRRDPLVRPPRGLPHRGARADEGADGQERRDRAGGSKGGVRGQAAACRGPRGAAGGGRGLLPHLHQRTARPDRQHRKRRRSRRRPTSCATTRTTPTSLWPPTRGPRHSPTWPTESRTSTASGSATPSPPAARPATTTSRSASPPAAPGSRSSATSASSAKTCTRRTFSVVGIGDMSGDVFGNGMLLSRRTRLIGAFNHRDVFVDPDPDPDTSWEERRRLMDLPRSSWSDYDRDRISPGGGVFPRTAKSIQLSPQAREALGVDAEAMTPAEVIRALLRAPVDLLWNGGIGTYVKASLELHGEVGDKANDAVRVNADELRCRVIGEGGNLGLTQRARIEYALGGGRVNTDAIDNSGGVDCSDREVNIKVLLDAVVADGDLTGKQRNELLAQMSDAVSRLVLKDNYEQAETLSLAEAQAESMLDVHRRFIRSLEQSPQARQGTRVAAERG